MRRLLQRGGQSQMCISTEARRLSGCRAYRGRPRLRQALGARLRDGRPVAFDSSFGEASCYLDRESGTGVTVTEDIEAAADDEDDAEGFDPQLVGAVRAIDSGPERYLPPDPQPGRPRGLPGHGVAAAGTGFVARVGKQDTRNLPAVCPGLPHQPPSSTALCAASTSSG